MKMFQLSWVFTIFFALILKAQAALTVPAITAQSRSRRREGRVLSGEKATISHQQIQQSGATTITQVLATQSRIQLQDLTGDGSEVSVGMSGFGDNAASNVLILVDGVPQNNPDLATVNLNHIPLDDVDHIDILSGSQSVRYGDQAVGGVINIITKDPKKRSTQATIGYGSYHHRLVSLLRQQRFDNGWQYQLGANLNFTNNYRDHNHDNQGNVLAGVGYHYDSGSIDIKYNYYRQYLQYAGALTAAQAADDRRQKEPNTNNEEYDQRHNLTTHWQQLMSSHWLYDQLLSYQYYDAHGELFGPMRQYRQAVFWQPDFEGHYKHHVWHVGGVFNYDTYDLHTVGDSDSIEQTEGSLFARWKDVLNPKWSMQLGLRAAALNARQDQSQAFVTSQAIVWQPTEQQSLSFERAGNYRFPKSEENAQAPVGITHLKTQRGADYTLAYVIQETHWQLHLDAYWLQLNDEIAFDPYQAPSRPYGENRNLDPTRHIGFDVASNYQVLAHWTLGAQYSYVDARFRSGHYQGNQVPFVSQDVVNLSSQLQFLIHWYWHVDTQYMSHRFASGDDDNQGHGIPGFWLVNTGLQWRNSHWRVSLQLNNLLNEHYNAYATYVQTQGQSGGIEYYYPAAGRNVMLTLSVS